MLIYNLKLNKQSIQNLMLNAENLNGQQGKKYADMQNIMFI